MLTVILLLTVDACGPPTTEVDDIDVRLQVILDERLQVILDEATSSEIRGDVMFSVRLRLRLNLS